MEEDRYYQDVTGSNLSHGPLHIDLSEKFNYIILNTQQLILQQPRIISTMRQIGFNNNLEMSIRCNKVFKLRSLFCGPKFDLKVGIILRMLSALNLANNGIFR